jgi:hypothetical protein
VRYGVYAPDLLITGVAELDLFSWNATDGPLRAPELCVGLGLAEWPTDVLLSYCATRGLVDRDIAHCDRVSLTDLARHHLVDGSALDLRAYSTSVAERPTVRELIRIPRTDEQATWASSGAADWVGGLDDPGFAGRITAAMDARSAFLAPALAEAISGVPLSALLDVGGSSGVYASALVDRRPGARAAVLERPPVDAAARRLLLARGYAGRVDVSSRRDVDADPGQQATPATRLPMLACSGGTPTPSKAVYDTSEVTPTRGPDCAGEHAGDDQHECFAGTGHRSECGKTAARAYRLRGVGRTLLDPGECEDDDR